MGWLGDSSHRGQCCQAWTAVGLPPRYPQAICCTSLIRRFHQQPNSLNNVVCTLQIHHEAQQSSFQRYTYRPTATVNDGHSLKTVLSACHKMSFSILQIHKKITGLFLYCKQQQNDNCGKTDKYAGVELALRWLSSRCRSSVFLMYTLQNSSMISAISMVLTGCLWFRLRRLPWFNLWPSGWVRNILLGRAS